jgi:hypothetical protein
VGRPGTVSAIAVKACQATTSGQANPSEASPCQATNCACARMVRLVVRGRGLGAVASGSGGLT